MSFGAIYSGLSSSRDQRVAGFGAYASSTRGPNPVTVQGAAIAAWQRRDPNTITLDGVTGLVELWEDKARGGNPDLDQTNDALQPAFAYADGVKYDGLPYLLNTAHAPLYSLPGGDDTSWSMFSTFKILATQSGATGVLVCWSDTSTALRYCVFGVDAFDDWIFIKRVGGDITRKFGPAVYGAYVSMVFVADGTTHKLYINGTQVGGDQTVNLGNLTGLNQFTMGLRYLDSGPSLRINADVKDFSCSPGAADAFAIAAYTDYSLKTFQIVP